MHVKRIHEMIEKLTECAKAEIDSGIEQVNTEELGMVVDIIKDLCSAEKDCKIIKQMEQSEEEEKKSDEYFLRVLKEEYGDDEGKRYYDNYRYANGRFAPKGRGSYRPRRSYEEMPFYRMMEESPEWYRDMDRQSMNRMYYSGGVSGGNGGGSSRGYSGGSSGGGQGSVGSSGSSSGGAGASSGSSSGSGGSMGYSEGMRGYGDGNGSSRGYDDGYSKGYSDGRSSRSRSESRSERARRGYTETKEMHKGDNPADKQANMKELENYFSELGEDMAELVKNMSIEERNLAKTKINSLANKL